MTAVRKRLETTLNSPNRVLLAAVVVAYVLWTVLKADDMGQLFNFTVIGIAEGAVFAIAASGLVLTYATTGVFNFAHGAIGMMAAFLYYALTRQHDVPVPVALLLILLVFAPVTGLAIELVMRRFKDASVQTTVVVTIALTILLIGVAQKMFPPDSPAKLPPLIKGDSIHLFSARPTRDNVLQLAVAIVVAIVLRFVLFSSRTGTAMRAVVDNPDLAALNGAPPVTIARYSWMLGSLLAALAGVLIASSSPIDPIVLTFAVAGTYGCAVFGRLRSIPLAFLGAIILGLVKNYAEFNFPSGQVWTSVKTAIPALFLFFALLLVPAAKLSVGRIVGRKAPAVPGRVASVLRAVGFVVVLIVVSHLAPADRLPDMTRAMIFALLLLSLVVLTGLSGQISLCQYVFMALGAWAMGHVAGGASLFGIFAAGLVAIPLGVIIAVPTLRLQGLYLALATFGFASASTYLLLDHPDIFGNGNVEVGRLKLLGYSFASNESFFVLCGLFFALGGVALLAIKRGPVGRRLAALRDSQAACATLGLDVRRTKLLVFSISAFIAGIAGALFGGLSGTAGTIQFDPINNIVLLLFAVVGGITTVTGAFIGGVLFALLPYVQSEYPDQAGLVFAVVAVAAVALGRQPNGIAGIIYDRVDRVKGLLAGPPPAAEPDGLAPAGGAAHPEPAPAEEAVGAPA